MPADRYLRLGTPVPAIYHGTLSSLSQALRDARLLSERRSGQHQVFAVRDGEWEPLQVYENGVCTWARRQEKGL
jgi:hypothetical protein